MDKFKLFPAVLTLAGVLAALMAMDVAVNQPNYLLPIMTVLLGVGGFTLMTFAYIEATRSDITKEIREMQNLADNTP